MTQAATLYALAALLFILFLAVGMMVTRFGIGLVDTAALSFRGRATKLALFFTYTGRGPFLTIAYIVAIAAFALLHKPIWIPVVLASSQMVTQGVANLFKRYYSRVRPDYWLVLLEDGHAYPSGHATTAVVTFVGWGIVCGFSPFSMPLRETLVTLFILWAVGIDWSRLALGAHYVTDVMGGTLIGFSWLCLLVGVFSQLFAVR